MWPLISPASGAPVSFIFDLMRLWPVFHISGCAAELGNAVEQRLARLHVGDDRRAGQLLKHRLGEDHQQLVAPDHAALAVDRADPVAVAVESDPEVELLALDELLEVCEVLLDRRIGMVVREACRRPR